MRTLEERTAKVGEAIVYTDPVGVAYNALVTAVWSAACINLIYVSGDDSRKDQYGRQIERQTSNTRKNPQSAHGNFWDFPEP